MLCVLNGFVAVETISCLDSATFLDKLGIRISAEGHLFVEQVLRMER